MDPPFYDLNLDNGVEGYFERVKKVANLTHDCAWGSRPLFDTILLQPGTFFYDPQLGLKANDITELVGKINGWNSNGMPTMMGLQFEFDMGLVTGRDDPNYSLRNNEKKSRLNDYFKAVKMLKPGTPLGIYSGGPNEQGYANTKMNANRHNTGNYRVQDSWQRFEYMNKVPYIDFSGAYDGNLIYDINNYLFRGDQY